MWKVTSSQPVYSRCVLPVCFSSFISLVSLPPLEEKEGKINKRSTNSIYFGGVYCQLSCWHSDKTVDTMYSVDLLSCYRNPENKFFQQCLKFHLHTAQILLIPAPLSLCLAMSLWLCLPLSVSCLGMFCLLCPSAFVLSFSLSLIPLSKYWKIAWHWIRKWLFGTF